MTLHRCTDARSVVGYIMCSCIRGHDHDAAHYGLPLGQHPEVTERMSARSES